MTFDGSISFFGQKMGCKSSDDESRMNEFIFTIKHPIHADSFACIALAGALALAQQSMIKTYWTPDICRWGRVESESKSFVIYP
jgi:hypothetical protein